MQRMDSFEFNKIAGAILGTALVVFGLKELAGAIYHADAPEKPGMIIEVANAATESGQGETEAEGAPKVSISTLMASANPDNGPDAMKSCKACHNWTKDGANKAGPNLWDVVGRGIGAADGFKYSAAFKEKSSETWSYEALNEFLAKPKDYIPGTKLGFAGIKNDEMRADVIAYLRTLSDDPKPLPTE